MTYLGESLRFFLHEGRREAGKNHTKNLTPPPKKIGWVGCMGDGLGRYSFDQGGLGWIVDGGGVLHTGWIDGKG